MSKKKGPYCPDFSLVAGKKTPCLKEECEWWMSLEGKEIQGKKIEGYCLKKSDSFNMGDVSCTLDEIKEHLCVIAQAFFNGMQQNQQPGCTQQTTPEGEADYGTVIEESRKTEVNGYG